MTPPYAVEKPATHPVFEALERARAVEDPLPPDVRAELNHRADELVSGRVQGVEHEDVPAWLEAHAREPGELAE